MTTGSLLSRYQAQRRKAQAEEPNIPAPADWPADWPALLAACLTEYGAGQLYGTLLGLQAMGVRIEAGKLVPPDDYGRGWYGDPSDDEPAAIAWERDRERFLKPYTSEIRTLFRAMRGMREQGL